VNYDDNGVSMVTFDIYFSFITVNAWRVLATILLVAYYQQQR